MRLGHRLLRSDVGARHGSEGAAAHEIDALFDDAIGRKIVRSALEPAPASAPVKVDSEKTDVDLTLKLGEAHHEQRGV